MIRKSITLILMVLFYLPVWAKPGLTIVYYDAFPPYSFVNEDGEMSGIFIDIVDQVIGLQMGINVMHHGYPWERAQRMVQFGEADAFISVATASRLEYSTAANEPVIIGPMNLFINANSKHKDRLLHVERTDDLSSFLILDYQGNNWGNQNFPADRFERYLASNLSNALIMLAHQRGDLIATDSIVADYLLAQLGLSEQVIELPVRLAEVAFSLCVAHSSSFLPLLPEFERQMAIFRAEGGIDHVLANYR